MAKRDDPARPPDPRGMAAEYLLLVLGRGCSDAEIQAAAADPAFLVRMVRNRFDGKTAEECRARAAVQILIGGNKP